MSSSVGKTGFAEHSAHRAGPLRDSPEPSGMDRTKVGSILTDAVGLKSRERPFFISFLKRVRMSIRISSESLMAYRYLSIWGKDKKGEE